MDFEEFNFDDILSGFLDEESDGGAPPSETDNDSEYSPEDIQEAEFEVQMDYDDASEDADVDMSYSGDDELHDVSADEEKRNTDRSAKNTSGGRKNSGRSRESGKSRSSASRHVKPERSPEDEEKEARKRAREAERQAEKEAERQAREAEREEIRRRKTLEKKADRRAIMDQKRAAEREREEIREFQEQERAAKKERDTEGRRRSRIGLVVFVAVIALLVVGTVFAANRVYESGKSLPNLFVSDIPVGNMTREQIAASLSSSGWQEKVSTPLTVDTFGGISFTVNPVDAGLALTMEDAVEKTCAYGRDGGKFSVLYKYIECLMKPLDINDANTSVSQEYISSRIEEGQRLLSEYVGTEPYSVDLKAGELRAVKGAGNLELEPVGLYNAIVSAIKDGVPEIVYNVVTREPVMPDFAAIHSELAKEMVNAKYSDDGRYSVIDETIGCEFDVGNAVSIWNSTQTAETAVIPLNVTWPDVTGDELRARLYNDLLGTCTTYYPLSSDERINNVNLCASKVNGTILYPGDLFSYNNTVGERTEAAGFKYAAAYSDGEVVEELGGGACQVSSTIYCSTLYARLETVERTCHQFEVAYFDQLGLDATVSWPEPDFKFRNNKTYPIKIAATCDNEERSLTVEIWGTAEDDYTVELKTDRYQHVNADGAWVGWRTVTYRYLYDSDGNIVKQTDKDGNPCDYEYTYTDEEGKPLMDTYMFH